jgi:hypothetical protein
MYDKNPGSFFESQKPIASVTAGCALRFFSLKIFSLISFRAVSFWGVIFMQPPARIDLNGIPDAPG